MTAFEYATPAATVRIYPDIPEYIATAKVIADRLPNGTSFLPDWTVRMISPTEFIASGWFRLAVEYPVAFDYAGLVTTDAQGHPVVTITSTTLHDAESLRALIRDLGVDSVRAEPATPMTQAEITELDKALSAPDPGSDPISGRWTSSGRDLHPHGPRQRGV